MYERHSRGQVEMGSTARVVLPGFLLLGCVLSSGWCQGLTVQLSLNQSRYLPSDSLGLRADVDVQEDTQLGDVFLYVELPHVTAPYGRVYLPLKQYGLSQQRPDGFYGAPVFKDVHLAAGSYEFTLLEGEITQVLPMVSGVGRYAIALERGEGSGWDRQYFPLGSISFDFGDSPGYPWLYYLDYPGIHCAFADAGGDLIVSTGDWRRVDSEPGWYEYDYLDGALYLINEDHIDTLLTPEDFFLVEGVADAAGKTWVVIGEGLNWSYRPGKQIAELDGAQVGPHFGYQQWQYRWNPGSAVRNREFALVTDGHLAKCPELTDAVPGETRMLNVDPTGRIFAVSWAQVRDGYIADFAVSWWEPIPPYLVQVLSLADTSIPDAVVVDYPQFGPDGLAYVLTCNWSDASKESAVLCIDPASKQWHVYGHLEYPLPYSGIEYFYVDPMNVKWFGTTDGLVRFDGESWNRFDTRNSNLPHNLVLQMAYDEVADFYYVISKGQVSTWDFEAACSTMSASQEFTSVHTMAASSYPWDVPTIFQHESGTWWLSPPLDRYSIYSYDHRRVVEWDFRDWLPVFYWELLSQYYDFSTYESMATGGRLAGPTGGGRTFCVTRTSVLVW